MAQALKEVLQLEEDLRADEVGGRGPLQVKPVLPNCACQLRPAVPPVPPGWHCLSRGP